MTDSTKRRILEATLAMVGEGGFSSLTVRAIAERADTSVSAVNYHFGSKDEAIAQAFRFVTEDFEAAFEPLRDRSLPARARLDAFVLAFIEAVHEHGAALAFFVGRLGGRAGPRGGVSDSQAMKAPEPYRSFVSHEGMDLVLKTMGQIAPGIRAREVSMRLSMLAGAMLYPELVPGALGLDFEKAATRKDYGRLAIAAFMNGLG